MRKQHSWSNKPICRIDISAFVSVMVVLLFCLWADQAIQPDMPRTGADLFSARHAVFLSNAKREDAMIVTVRRDGHYFFGPEQVSLVELTARIKDTRKHRVEQKVYLRADRHARYGDVQRSLASIRAAGIENVAFLTNLAEPR